MDFKNIYKHVESYKGASLDNLLKEFNIKIIHDDALCYTKDARMVNVDGVTLLFIKEGLSDETERFLILHEIGHLVCGSSWLRNCGANEMDANTFACLYLLNNQIQDAHYFQVYLKEQGVPQKIADAVQERIYQFKMAERYGNDWLIMEC